MFLWLLLFFSVNSILHPIHSSITNINYSEKQKVFEISTRIYKNDLQKVILKKYGYPINFDKKTLSDSTKFYVTDYIKRNLFLITGKKIYNKLKFKSFKINDDAIWLNFILPFKKKPSMIIIHNSILNDLFSDQKNLVIFTYYEQKEGLTFTKNASNKEILLK